MAAAAGYLLPRFGSVTRGSGAALALRAVSLFLDPPLSVAILGRCVPQGRPFSAQTLDRCLPGRPTPILVNNYLYGVLPASLPPR
jgi:hypothetical protein